MGKRVFLIVLDSFGIGAEPDAAEWGDEGSNTLCACATTGELNIPNMASLGLLNIEGALESPYDADLKPVASPTGAFARLRKASAGKDTTVGHWEMAGRHLAQSALPTYPNGFPQEILDEFEPPARAGGFSATSRTPVRRCIKDYGREQLETGKLIVYTSADSVFQIAAHEDSGAGAEQLYRVLPQSHAEILTGRARRCPRHCAPLHGGVARLRAHRRVGTTSLWNRTGTTMLDVLKDAAGTSAPSAWEINDIFAHRGITEHVFTSGNNEGIERTVEYATERDFAGLCYANLVDFDMVYGHRNDVARLCRAP